MADIVPAEWANKLNIKIDSFNIDSDLTHFPVAIVLGSSVGKTGFDATDFFTEMAYPVNDDFIGEDGDAPDPILWSIANNSVSGSALINGNKLRLTIPDTANDEEISVGSSFVLNGDFDIQVDYIEVSDDAPTSSLGYPARLKINSEITGNTSSVGTIISSSGGRTMVADGTSTTWQQVSDHVVSGKFRFTRVGTTIKGYYWDSSRWEWNGSTSGLTFSEAHSDDIHIQFMTSADFNSGAVTDFDNFIINSADAIIWPENTHPNRKKIAITKGDGISQLYGEIEHWDSTNKKAVIRVSKDDFVVSSTEDTGLVLYYDPDQDDNTRYIGEPGQEYENVNITGDDFTGDDGDAPNTDLWIETDVNSNCAILSNQLHYDSEGVPGTADITSKFILSGDFDIQVDYAITTWTIGSNYTYAILMNLKNGAGANIGLVGRGISNVGHKRVIAEGTDTGFTTYINTDETGTIRLTRVSGVIKAYEWDTDDWKWNGSTAGLTIINADTSDLHVQHSFRCRDGSDLDTVIDNFKINSGNVKFKPSVNVYDPNFKAVYHMAQDPSGDAPQLLDSTSNTNDGTSEGAMTTSDLVDGQIGKALDFDGTDDRISLPEVFSVAPSEVTWELILKSDIANTEEQRYFGFNEDGIFLITSVNGGTTNLIRVYCGSPSGGGWSDETSTYSVTDWRYIVGTSKESDFLKLYVDSIKIGTDVAITTFEEIATLNRNIGASRKEGFLANGLVAEVRLSDIVRSADWIKATNYAETDALVTVYTDLPLPIEFFKHIRTNHTNLRR